MDMELGTMSILAQLGLILLLVALFTGHRHLRAWRERRQVGGRSASTTSSSASPAAPVEGPWSNPTVPPAPLLVDLPPMAAQRLVSDDLLPPLFADTCADWAAMGGEANTRFSLADWSAPTDRVALDVPPEPTDLVWAERTPVQPPPQRPVERRMAAAAMSCTIAPQQAYPLA